MQQLIRRLVFLVATLLLLFPLSGQSAETVGLLLLHGKNPGGPGWQGHSALTTKLEQAGIRVLVPEMPWSRQRYLDADFGSALREIDTHVKKLRSQGAQRIVIAGHSMGCPAAMAYAARQGGVDALVLLAPGHVPVAYYNRPNLSIVRESVDKARALVAQGEGDKANQSFSDINQGNRLSVFTSANTFLSYFDPTSDAEMSVTAPRIPAGVPLLWVIGKSDPLFAAGRSYVFDKLPVNTRSRYLEVDANHLSTPSVAAEQTVAWITEVLAKNE